MPSLATTGSGEGQKEAKRNGKTTMMVGAYLVSCINNSTELSTAVCEDKEKETKRTATTMTTATSTTIALLSK